MVDTTAAIKGLAYYGATSIVHAQGFLASLREAHQLAHEVHEIVTPAQDLPKLRTHAGMDLSHLGQSSSR